MFYGLIISSKLKFSRAVFHIFLIVSYLTTFSSCMTTYNYSESPDTIDKISSDEITKIELINGTFINCKDKVITYEKGADSVKYIVVKSVYEGKDYKAYHSEKRISEKDILKIHIEHSEINAQNTFLLVLGIVIVTGILVFIIGFATSKTNTNWGEF